MQKQIVEKPHEQLTAFDNVNPRVFEVIAGLSNEPDALALSIEHIGDEQCVVARVNQLTDEMKADFEGAGESDDETLRRNWRDISNDISGLGGAGDTEVQAVRTGQTGRQKEIQIALFGIRNAEELMQKIHELNQLRKEDGIQPQEAVPEDLAYLPDSLLIATRDLRQQSAEELRRVTDSRNQAVGAGVLAVGGKESNRI